MSGGAAYSRALELIGSRIVSGEWEVGRGETIDGLVVATDVSRTIVREVTRELVAARLLSASPRVGLRVRPRAEWDLLDLRVVRWRLQVGDRAQQLRELRELRAAVEPEAAALAAASRSGSAVLSDAASALAAADDEPAFLRADQRFHRAMLQASGNAMLAGLGSLVDTALEDRALVERHGRPPSAEDVALHAAVATAVRDGRVESARAAMRRIVDLTAEG